MLSLILMVFAFVLFAVAAMGSIPEPPWKSRLACIGLACWVLSEIVKGMPLMR